MRYVDLPVEGGAKVSVLGFGCSALLGRAGRAESLTALGAAMDAGITFYDTARSYGYGESEGLLGEFFAGRRKDVVLCTKFGIVPGAKGGWKQRVKPLAQAVIRAVPALRGMARKAAAGTSVESQFTVEVLRGSIETSLRELRTDYVDMLLVHGATMEVLGQTDLLEAMGRLVSEGKVRMAGISAEHDVVAEAFGQPAGVLRTAQFAMNPGSWWFVSETVREKGMLLVANHPFGGVVGVGALRAQVASLAGRADLPVELREKLGAGDAQVLPEVVLNGILSGTGVSSIVPAMMKVEHLKNNVRAVEVCRFLAEELEVLRAELGGKRGG